MTPTQQAALEALAGRPLTADEVQQITPLLADPRRDDLIADILSVGRTRVRQPYMIGDGTVSDTFGAGGAGPLFCYSLALLGTLEPLLEDATIEQRVTKALAWQAWRRLSTGTLDIGLPGVRATMDAMVGELPGFTQDMANAIKALALVPDPISERAVTLALNET